MFGWFRKAASPQARQALTAASSEPLPGELVLFGDTRLPIPDWSRQPWPQTQDADARHRHANGLAAAWVDALGAALPQGHARAESDHFMLLSTLQPRPCRVLLDYLERSRRRVLATLDGVAQETGEGKSVVMVFADESLYYDYISHYGDPSGGPEAFSAGMFIDAGYGHFAFTQGAFETMEAVVIHELTHCLVRHLDIPAWLNEGLAVNVEQRFVPTRARHAPSQLTYLFGRFWTAATIQEFWNGKSFLRADEGQALSYELARILVELLGKDYDQLRRLCHAALRADGGDAAAREVTGMDLEALAGAVLGPGPWRPDPASWTTGTEKGQF